MSRTLTDNEICTIGIKFNMATPKPEVLTSSAVIKTLRRDSDGQNRFSRQPSRV